MILTSYSVTSLNQLINLYFLVCDSCAGVFGLELCNLFLSSEAVEPNLLAQETPRLFAGFSHFLVEILLCSYFSEFFLVVKFA